MKMIFHLQLSAHIHRPDDLDRHPSSGTSSSSAFLPATPESRGADLLAHISERHNSYRWPACSTFLLRRMCIVHPFKWTLLFLFYSRLSAADQSSANKTKSHRYCRHAQGAAAVTPSGKPNFDSGKSSDSSLSSSYRHGHEGGSLRMDQRSKTDNTYVPHHPFLSGSPCILFRTKIHQHFVVGTTFFFSKSIFSYRKIQESSSSHSIPHVALSSSDTKTPSLTYSSVSNAMDVGNFSAAHSSSTPQFKKKLLGDKQGVNSARDNSTSSHIAKHQSFDYSKSTITHYSNQFKC